MQAKYSQAFRHGKVFGLVLCALIFLQAAHADWRLKTMFWNVESGDSQLGPIESVLSDTEGVDVFAFAEVLPSRAEALNRAASVGEGAKGNPQADFDYTIGTTGNDLRLMICWDNLRFEKIGETQELHNLNSGSMNHRSPLYIQLRNRSTDNEFIVMVNHLARGDDFLRNAQAQGLANWAAEQELPVIALGDYNFDYDIDDGEGNEAFDTMLDNTVWRWLKPERMMKSQASESYYSILDFVFVANIPEHWTMSSSIVELYTPFVDNSETVDHRPLEAVFFVGAEVSIDE